MNFIKHIINGESVGSISGRSFASENPATEEQIAEVAFGEAADVNAAVDSAAKAFKSWSRMAGGRSRKVAV